jgi:autoinducer 2 (AI-2) kinase
METLAARVPPGADGVIGLFSAVHNSKFWKHAAPSFINFNIYNPEKSGKAQCIRALWESAVYASYGHVEVLRQLTNTTPERIRFCGGAAKGFLWPQILADVVGVPVTVPVVKEATSFGCAMCVGVATKVFRTLSQAAECWVKVEREFEPSPDLHAEYLRHYGKWQKVYSEFMKIVNQGLLTPMWRAPGT